MREHISLIRLLSRPVKCRIDIKIQARIGKGHGSFDTLISQAQCLGSIQQTLLAPSPTTESIEALHLLFGGVLLVEEVAAFLSCRVPFVTFV
jgi:hypothetical protein